MGEMRGALAAGVLGVVMAVALFQAILQLQAQPGLAFTPSPETMAANTTVARYGIATGAPETAGTMTVTANTAGPIEEARKDAGQVQAYIFTYPMVAGISLAVAGLAYIILRRGVG
jgi:hypothetical protein